MLKLMLFTDTGIIICYNYLMDRFLLAFLFRVMLVSITNILKAKIRTHISGIAFS